MKEIWIPELVSMLLLLFYILQPWIKDFNAHHGALWFPYISLAIALAIFPAYGFRPECIPLLLFLFVFCVIQFPLLKSQSYASYYKEAHSLGMLINFAAAILFGGFSLFFAPANTITIVDVRKLDIQAPDGTPYFLRLYEGPAAHGYTAKKPLVILVPPVFGSTDSVNRLYAALGERGFSVLSFSRRNFDGPAVNAQDTRFSLGLFRQWDLYRTLNLGTASQDSNLLGQSLETERRSDLRFLLSWITLNPVSSDGTPFFKASDLERVFLCGFYAGGSAAIQLSSDADFPTRFPWVSGVIAIESLLYSSFAIQTWQPEEIPAGAGRFEKTRYDIETWFESFWAKPSIALKQTPAPQTPLLLVLSDKAGAVFANTKADTGSQYAAIHKLFLETEAARELAIVQGAGPLDFADYFQELPLFAFFFPAQAKRVNKNMSIIEETAMQISDFAAGIASDTQKPKPPEGNETPRE